MFHDERVSRRTPGLFTCDIDYPLLSTHKFRLIRPQPTLVTSSAGTGGQQDLRDRTFRQGQDQRQRGAERGPQGRQGQKGHQGQQGQQGQQGDSFGDLRQSQQSLRDRLNKLLETAVSARTSKVSRASRVEAKAI